MKSNNLENNSKSKEDESSYLDIHILKSVISCRPFSKFFYIVTFVLQIDLVINLYTKWGDPISRLLTLKEFLLSWIGLLGYLASNDSKNVLNYVRCHFEKYKNSGNYMEEQIEIIEERNKRLKKYNIVVSILVTHILHITCGLIPYLLILVSMLKCYLKGDNFKNLPEIVHSYFPKAFGSSLIFQLIYHSSIYVWYSLLLYNWAILAKSMLFNFTCFATEIKLLCYTMDHIDDAVNSGTQTLQAKLRDIVIEHQSIRRGLHELENKASKMMFGLVNLYGSQICIYLAFITLINDMNIKMRYITRYFVTFAFVYFTSENGQNITDLGGELRLSLCHCPWADKPIWFRKTILLMNTMATKEMVVRPFGLYVLDIGCIVTILKGTYTYLNFAKKLLD